jgi:hypothetical protein
MLVHPGKRVKGLTVRTCGATHPLIHRHSQQDLRRFLGRHGSDQRTAFVTNQIGVSIFKLNGDQASATIFIAQIGVRNDGKCVVVETGQVWILSPTPFSSKQGGRLSGLTRRVDDLDALQRQTQQRLIEFLRTDLELAHTFVELAVQHLEKGDRAGYERLLQKTRRALEAVHRFEGKVFDPQVRTEIQNKLWELEKLLFSDNSLSS